VEKHHATIESAQPLDGGMSEQVVNNLKSKYGAAITTEFKVTPELIGGLRIKIGSDVFDSSVRNRIDRLETQLIHA
jgi:F-type H+-transporting ATPase subunit delta